MLNNAQCNPSPSGYLGFEYAKKQGYIKKQRKSKLRKGVLLW